MSEATQDPRLQPPRIEEYTFNEWTLKVVKSHIMGSQCENTTQCTVTTNTHDLCNYCMYERELQLPSLPDMVFADNLVQITHRDGGSVSFTALDALKCVNPNESSVEVAHAEVWREAR